MNQQDAATAGQVTRDELVDKLSIKQDAFRGDVREIVDATWSACESAMREEIERLKKDVERNYSERHRLAKELGETQELVIRAQKNIDLLKAESEQWESEYKLSNGFNDKDARVKSLEAEIERLKAALSEKQTALDRMKEYHRIELDRAESLEARLTAAVEGLEFYAGNFDGKEGSRWSVDLFFIETKIGTAISAAGPLRAKQVLASLKESKT